MSPTSPLTPGYFNMSRFILEPFLSLRDAWLFDITCALVSLATHAGKKNV
jgi:hypothetical protein